MREESVANVLIVGDEAATPSQFSDTLQKFFRVTTAFSGDLALRLVEAGSTSCVLLDYPIHGCDALELTETLTQRRVPVVMLTAGGSERVAVAALKRGALDYLVKSEVSGEELVSVIRTAVRQSDEQRILEERQKQLESFAFLAGHDLRSPLQVVRLSAEVLHDRLTQRLSREEHELFESISNGCRTMGELIEDLLDYSVLGRGPDRKCMVDLNELLCQLIDEMESSFRSVGARVELGQLPRVFAVRSSMRQVFQNLLSNALKFRASRPLVIEISAELQDATSWKFCVSDTGIGIAPENQNAIFEAFTRLHDAAEIEGNGIGLAAVKRAVELQGGKVWVDSGLGSGARFYFTVPHFTVSSSPVSSSNVSSSNVFSADGPLGC